MRHLAVVFVLLCIFACSSEEVVSTVEESVKPANEVAMQTVNLLDSLEIMDYIYSIIGPMAKTRSNLPEGGYIFPDNCFAYSLGFDNKWIEFSTWDQVRYGYENASSVYHAAYDYMKGAT